MENLSDLVSYFEDEVQLTNVFIHKDEEDEILYSDELIITHPLETNRYYISFNMNIYPDFTFLASVELYKMFGEGLVVEDNFKYENGDILFGDEAEKDEVQQYMSLINEKANDLAAMDNLLLYYEGHEC